MKDKIWYSTEISTKYEQNIRIRPNEDTTDILIEIKESHDATYHNGCLFLDAATMEVLIAKMRETMEYIKQ
jgi:hypothetical protein